MKEYRGVVLSGGGARGSYGVGVLAALRAADQEKQVQVKNVFIGSSIGALNATLAAQDDIGNLIDLWKSLNVIDVLDEKKQKLKKVNCYCEHLEDHFSIFRILKLKK